MPLYPAALYDPAVPAPSWWAESARTPAPVCPPLHGEESCDVAVIGGGYTGLSAALHLARDHGLSVRVLEAGQPGWGASGRNGGFCCLGGTKLSYQTLIRRFGLEETHSFHRAQAEAIELVRDLGAEEGIELGVAGPDGEVCLAHRPGRRAGLQEEGAFLQATFGLACEWLEPTALAERGLGSSLHGGLFTPLGFGLQPLDYIRGLARAAIARGALLHGGSEVVAWERNGARHRLRTAAGTVTAERVIAATNGYDRESLLPGQAGRRLPVLSNILVTRPLSAAERSAQGWSATTLAYDSRHLLHYFRLLPDGRFLFGGRGGVSGGGADVARQRRWMEARFQAFFPAWATVGFTHFWNGFACLATDRLPHVGPVEGVTGAFQAFAYHGSGVAMGTWAGRAAAALAVGREPRLPAPLRRPPPRFPLPALRLLYLRSAYLGYRLHDERL